MGRKITIAAIQFAEAMRQQLEVLGFFKPDLHPVIEEAARHAGVREPGDQIPSHVDGVELDVGEGMEQCEAATRSMRRTAGHVAWGRRSGREGRPGCSGIVRGSERAPRSRVRANHLFAVAWARLTFKSTSRAVTIMNAASHNVAGSVGNPAGERSDAIVALSHVGDRSGLSGDAEDVTSARR